MHDGLSRKDPLTGRLHYLWTGELFNIFFLPATVLYIAHTLQQPIGPLILYSVGMVIWILGQGSAYWWLKLQGLKVGQPISDTHMRWFAIFKKVNGCLLSAAIVLVGVGLATHHPFTLFDGVTGAAFYLLAILEQINYYHYQLMYDCPSDWRYLMQHKKLKRSNLSRTLEQAQNSLNPPTTT